MDQAKPFCISKWCFVEAFKQVKASKGGAGGDGQTIEEFEGGLKDNLYKLWNRMSSGSYFPPPVLRAEIPKGDGRMRPLGIPTVADRVAQQVVKQELEPVLERHFHSDSYGYRPGKSALDAVERARRNCWKYNWVLDLDIKGFFDNIDHDLLMKAVRWHTEEKWVLLYIERWLKAPILMTDGTMFYPEKGTSQGGVISPLLANLYYAFDVNFSPAISSKVKKSICRTIRSLRLSRCILLSIDEILNSSLTFISYFFEEVFTTWCRVSLRRGGARIHGAEHDLLLKVLDPPGTAFSVEDVPVIMARAAKPRTLRRLACRLPKGATSFQMEIAPAG